MPSRRERQMYIRDRRTIAHNLMPDSLRRCGLKVSLGDFCKAVKEAEFKYFGDDVRRDQRLEEVIYNCAHELINNALKHADAQNIKVELMVDGENILLTVFDDGRSFDTENVTYGMGLENIKSKIAVYNGKMDITSTPGKGTEINIEIERLNR